LKYVIVPEAQDSEPLLLQISISGAIYPRMTRKIMLSTIKFNDEPRRVACKVDDVTIDWHLSSEVEPVRLQQSKMPP